MILAYGQEDSFLHRLDIRTKLFGFLTATVWCFLFQHPLYNLSLLCGMVVLTVLNKISFHKVWQMLCPLLPIFFILFLFTGMTYPLDRFHSEIYKVALFSLNENWKLFSLGGILTGVNFICRLLIMVLGSMLLTLTTSLEEFMDLLNRLRVPGEISFMLTTAIRFIPTLDKKRIQILEAQKARGAKINDRGIIGNITSYLPIMVPLFINSILLAEDLAKGMLNRGYGYTTSIATIPKTPLQAKDYWALSFLVLLLSGGLYLRLGLKLGVL